MKYYTVISLAENVTTLYCVLPVCQRGQVTRGLNSITIPDGVIVTHVFGNIPIPGGASHRT